MSTHTRCNVVLCVCALMFLCTIVQSMKIPKEADSSDGCKVKHKFYRVGQQWRPKGVCELHTCYKGGAIGGVICPLLRLPEDSKCYLTEEDVSKDWPECCGGVVCPPN